MPFPSGEPPWQVADLNQLASDNQLSGINPTILAGIAQAESGFEVAGAGINSGGYGGFYGLGQNSTYPAGQSTPTLLMDPSEKSFMAQSILAASSFSQDLAAANGSVARAETIYQDGPNSTGSSSAGVPLILAALGNGAAMQNSNTNPTVDTSSWGGTTGAVTPSGNASGPGSGSANATPSQTLNSSTATTSSLGGAPINLTGIGGVLQQLDGIMNPTPISGWKTILSLGTADVVPALEMMASRGIFTIGFLVIAYLGFKQLTGSGGGSATQTIIKLANNSTKNDLAQQRIDHANAETARKAGPQPVKRTHHTYGPKESTIIHVKGPAPAPTAPKVEPIPIPI